MKVVCRYRAYKKVEIEIDDKFNELLDENLDYYSKKSQEMEECLLETIHNELATIGEQGNILIDTLYTADTNECLYQY